MSTVIKSILVDVTTSSKKTREAAERQHLPTSEPSSIVARRPSSWLPTLLERSRRAPPPSVPSSGMAPGKGCGIKLLVTPIGPKSLPRKFQPFHTSVMVGERELSFGQSGVCMCRGAQSHQCLPRSAETKVMDRGSIANIDPFLLRRTLRPYFHQDSYDLLRKNCNSFSDVLLGILVGERLSKEYKFLEDLALSMDKNMFGVVRKLSNGTYEPNPLAASYSSAALILELKDRNFS